MLAKTELDEAHANLLRAAEYIEKYGWWNGQGEMPKVGGEACLMLAIIWTSSDDTSGPIDIIRKRLGGRSPAIWNDSHSKDEVIDLLREVAYS